MSKADLAKDIQAAIQVKGISKYYRLGTQEEQNDSIASSIFHALKSPIKNFKKYRSLYNFNDVNCDSVPDNVLLALEDISFSVNSGERVGIIGSNGAGKSTLLKVLSRITQPTKGTAVIRGRVSSLLEVGTGFHPELSGRENIYLNATILGMRKSEVDRKFDEIVAFAGVEKFLDTPVKRYSSGMKVRLAFAVAANLEPEILIVDEVLAVGDAEFQQKCLNKMEAVGKQGRTVLFVSHNMGAISRLCNRVLWLQQGHLIQDGNSDEVISAYLNAGTSGHATCQFEDVGQENSDAVLKIAQISDSKTKEPTTLTDFINPLEVEVEYNILRMCRDTAVLIRLNDAQGNIIFTSRDTDTTEWRDQPGRYHLSIGIAQSAKIVVMHENVLVFDVTSIGCKASPNRRGIIMPFLDWQVKFKSDSSSEKKQIAQTK
jgi:lipopolysaccharide transport system ATP-binding protein